MGRVVVVARPLGRGKVSVLSIDPTTGNPLDRVFVGTWRPALEERNRRLEEWSESADEVSAEPMPVEF